MSKFLRIVFFSLLSFSAVVSNAQEHDSLNQKIKISGYIPLVFSLSDLYGNETGKQFQHETGITAQSAINSTAVTLPFSFALLGNEFIDDEEKNDVSDRLLNRNAYEFSYDISAYGRWIRDSFLFHSPALYGIDVSSGNFTSTNFTNAAFNTVFYGNAQFAGQTADYSGTKFYSFSYNRIGFSAQKDFDGTRSKWQAGAEISLLAVRSGLNLRLHHATLFTEENGEYLDATYSFEYNQSDSTNTGRFQIDGTGFSLDLQCSWTNIFQTTRLSFFINDLGVTEWNKNTRIFSADSMVHFEGIHINDFLAADSSSFIHYSLDSFKKNTGTKERHESKTFFLPVSFSFLFTHSVSNKVLLNAGASYRPYSDLLPLVFVKPQWVLSSSCQIGIPFSAGGSARYSVGFDTMIKVKKQLHIVVGSGNILAILLPARTTSSSLFLQASFQF